MVKYFESFILLQRRLLGLWRFKVPVKNVRTPFGEPFDGSNHWVRTLEEYERGIKGYKQSSLYKFHKKFKPKGIFDTLSISEKQKNHTRFRYPLGDYPWSRWVQPISRSRWEKSRHIGPTQDSLIKSEYENFIRLYISIKTEGLKFRKYGHPVGVMLVDDRSMPAKYYYIVTGGNHRIAVAYFLGIKFVILSLPNE